MSDNVSSQINHIAHRAMAKRFYCSYKNNSLSNRQFDAVDWCRLDLALAKCTPSFRVWLAKQSSGFSTTGKQMERYSNRVTSAECPNCDRTEDATHLHVCSATSRTHLLVEDLRSLQE